MSPVMRERLFRAPAPRPRPRPPGGNGEQPRPHNGQRRPERRRNGEPRPEEHTESCISSSSIPTGVPGHSKDTDNRPTATSNSSTKFSIDISSLSTHPSSLGSNESTDSVKSLTHTGHVVRRPSWSSGVSARISWRSTDTGPEIPGSV